MDFYETEEWVQSCEWLQAHNIDPYMIPFGSLIVVNFRLHWIKYMKMHRDEKGNVILENRRDGLIRITRETEQGEAGPMPLPEILKETT